MSVIRPFPRHAVPRIWVWIDAFRHRLADDFGARTVDEFVAQWLAGKRQSWAVIRDGEPGGVVTFEPWSPVAGTMHVIFARRFWGADTTEPALREVLGQIFAQGYEKVVCMPFADNFAVIALARRLGFKREGTLRHQTRRNGEPVDMAVIGLTRAEFEGGGKDAGSSTIASDHIGSGSGSRGAGKPQQEDDAAVHQHANAAAGTGAATE